MFILLLALFIIFPLAELTVIFEIGSRIGYLYTILILVVISFAGAALAKRQGYAIVARIQADMRQGVMPGDSLIDGALILTGALLLLTPGFITDAVGLLLLLPPIRALVRTFVRRRLRLAVERRTVRVWTPGDRGGPGPEPPPEPEQRRKELEG